MKEKELAKLHPEEKKHLQNISEFEKNLIEKNLSTS